MKKIAGNNGDSTETQAAFQERMKAQCKQIEQYRTAVMRTEGRLLSRDEAALEWIECYAEDFAEGADLACAN